MKKILTIAMALFVCSAAFSQRTMNTQMFLEAGYASAKGAELTVGQYQNFGYWEAALHGSLHDAVLTTGEEFDFGHAALKGDYMFRLVASRSRSVNLYAGAGILGGWEVTDVFSQLPTDAQLVFPLVDDDEEVKDGSFVYGAYPKVTLEVFPFRTVALTLSAEADVVLGSQFMYLFPQVDAGIRIMLR